MDVWTPNGPMDERFRLSVREVPNNKVVYRSSTERALNFNGQALTNVNSFSGFSLDSDMFSTSENGLLSFGDDVMQALESQVGHIVNLGPATSNNTVQQETERLSRSQVYAEKLKNLVMSSIRKGNVFNGQSVSWLRVESERPYHGSIFWFQDSSK